MGRYTDDQIRDIIKFNPNKALVLKGREMNDKLMLHVYGKGMDSAIVQCEYFENTDIYSVRKQYAVSNKDLFARLLQQEDMVFSAKGGSSYFNMNESNEKTMNALLSNVRYGLSLRKWMHEFATPAYRTDPMGVIFIEIEQLKEVDGQAINTPKAYPTYKSIYSIHDYEPNGRRLEYVCFRLPAKQARAYGVDNVYLKEYTDTQQTPFFRFVDDEKDVIVKYERDQLTVIGQPIMNIWGRTNAFMVSDLMRFDEPKCFYSPLDPTVELADCFLRNRSIRDLQQHFHGFSKAVEPLLDCGKCGGTGLINASACPECSPYPGAKQGTGYKMRTKVSDVARFPLSLAETSFNWRNYFGYASPDVEGWNKQDTSLSDLGDLIHWTYWGTGAPQRATGPTAKPGENQDQTATKTKDDRQPRYARLNQTADWAESTEKMIADYIGQFWFREQFKKSSIAYGRMWVLESPQELMQEYQELRTKGAPEASLYEAMERYFHAMYQNNPIELAVRLKLLYVEPFPHLKVQEAKMIITDFLDLNCKIYFGEWYSTVPDMAILSTPADKLREQLREYVQKKNLKEPEPEPSPSQN